MQESFNGYQCLQITIWTYVGQQKVLSTLLYSVVSGNIFWHLKHNITYPLN